MAKSVTIEISPSTWAAKGIAGIYRGIRKAGLFVKNGAKSVSAKVSEEIARQDQAAASKQKK